MTQLVRTDPFTTQKPTVLLLGRGQGTVKIHITTEPHFVWGRFMSTRIPRMMTLADMVDIIDSLRTRAAEYANQLRNPDQEPWPTSARDPFPGVFERLLAHTPAVIPLASEHLTNAGLMARSLILLRHLFPDFVDLIRWHEVEDWVDVLMTIFRLVDDHDWFPIDWDLLESITRTWSDYDAEEYLARYLYFVPLRVIRPHEMDVEATPCLQVLAWAFDQSQLSGLPQKEQENFIPPLTETSFDPDDLYEAVITNPPPLGMLTLLPLAATIFRGETGNAILDATVDPWIWRVDPELTWLDDIDRLQEDWPKAQIESARFFAFVDWCHDRANLEDLVDYLNNLIEKR